MSSARTSEPHHRAGLVERHPDVLHQRAGRPRQGRHVGGAVAPQVESSSRPGSSRASRSCACTNEATGATDSESAARHASRSAWPGVW